MQFIIEIIKYIIIGIVQGVSEILPISSSGHLAIFYKLLNINIENQLNLTIYLHLASSIALCIYFKDIIIKVIVGTYKYIIKKERKEDFQLFIYLLLSSFPIAIIGLFIKPIIESFFDNTAYVSIGFIITSIILLLNKSIKNNDVSSYTFKNTFITGLIQCFSIFPGISRSATSLLGSKIAKLNNHKGKEFAFLLLIPISLGSTILSFFEDKDILFTFSPISFLYIISMLVSFIFTILSLKFIFKINQERYYSYYVIYLLLFAFLSLTFI